MTAPRMTCLRCSSTDFSPEEGIATVTTLHPARSFRVNNSYYRCVHCSQASMSPAQIQRYLIDVRTAVGDPAAVVIHVPKQQ